MWVLIPTRERQRESLYMMWMLRLEKFIYRCEVEVDNSSYLKASQNGQILYSIADEGVVAFAFFRTEALPA